MLMGDPGGGAGVSVTILRGRPGAQAGRQGWRCTGRTVMARDHLLELKATPQKATVVKLLWCAQHHTESQAALRKPHGWWKKSTEKHHYLSWDRSSYMHSWINPFYLDITPIFGFVLNCSKNFLKWKDTKLEQFLFPADVEYWGMKSDY